MIRPITAIDFEQVRQIFFGTSVVQVFPSEQTKSQFEWKYLGWYLETHKNLFFVADSSETAEAVDHQSQILGYIACCPDTQRASSLIDANPSLKVFTDLYEEFPAHLHINLSADARGKGLGSLLIQHLESKLKKQGVKGLHLLTSPDARNRSFYAKNGFQFEMKRPYKDASLLFMGKHF
jgi:GNAT superfamily N-acetyltransferase